MMPILVDQIRADPHALLPCNPQQTRLAVSYRSTHTDTAIALLKALLRSIWRMPCIQGTYI